MPITAEQIAKAEEQQWDAAQDTAHQIRLIAGPGTGKSATIERRVAYLLENGNNPTRIYVVSFTRATCAELDSRISSFCATKPYAAAAEKVRVSTMHSLALSMLRAAAVLSTLYPDDPMVLDDWERDNVYDEELASSLGCTPGRAEEIRVAHDAQWQTLNPQLIAQPPITNVEKQGFNAFHSTRRNLYCCVLPGEVIFECVSRIQQGAIQLNQLPAMDHLVVDEYQDLNACDQEFVRQLTERGARLFVAGDDDQSIYIFRHANPIGIVQFEATYPAATTHVLKYCFRCTPGILTPATELIAHNPNRIQKELQSLYADADPPVEGKLHVWSFATAQAEIFAIAQSCQRLINEGMEGQEDQIMILISNRRLQLGPITRALANLGLPFDPPGGQAIRDEVSGRAVYSILRLVKDQTTDVRDYVVYRGLMRQLHGVGVGTSKTVGDLCVAHNQNYRELFQLAAIPHWLTARAAAAVARVRSIRQEVAKWTLQDTIAERAADIGQLISECVFAGSNQAEAFLGEWNALAAALPEEMTLDELLLFLAADDEADQRWVLDAVNKRTGKDKEANEPAKNRIRILTMHGAKGLSGKVVFIPSAEQGIMPSFKAIRAAGLLNEQRRLFYVSMTRARATCIISHAALHVGAEAFLIQQKPQARLPRSQFLNEMEAPSRNRNGGLTAAETAQLIADINNL